MQDVAPQGGAGYRVALFNPASSIGQVSRLRLINPGTEAATVTIEGFDDTGASPGGAVRLTLAAGASRMVTAEELETGDGEGLSGALGDGEGRWRLVVTADRRIEVMNLLASSSSGAMSNLSSGPVAAVDGGDGATTIHSVGLFPSASNTDLEGVLRILNRTRQSGSVSIEAIDDTGTSYGPVTLEVDALEGLVINSGALEEGDAEKGLSVGTGAGSGDWRLLLSTSLDIAVLSYVRPLGVQDGLLSAMHDLVPRRSWGHQVTLLNPAETPGQSARLRLINPSASEAGITVRGVDGTGTMAGGEVRLTLAAGASREVRVSDLEGGTGTGLTGSLGEGEGQWHLGVSANRRLQVMSLLSGPSGHLANLSTAPSATLGVLADASGGAADTATAAEVFGEHISGMVQSLCIGCHVEEGLSGNTRLVFERSTTADHEALNLAVFSSLLSEVEGSTSYILNKIQGVSHGGGTQVPAGSPAFAQMERFLELLDGPSALFAQRISEAVVQSKCIACHVEGGVSGHTRLVFAPSTTADHEALNLQAFERFLSEAESGASLILNKVQGVSHGGGEQVPADSEDYAELENFLGRLDAGVVPAAITVDTLFDTVRMAPLRKTLRRAALIFAGRIPTEAEYASIYDGPTTLRSTIRNMMTGPEFHDFLIRGANDRLLTDREGSIIDGNNAYFVDYTNEFYERSKTANESGDDVPLWDYGKDDNLVATGYFGIGGTDPRTTVFWFKSKDTREHSWVKWGPNSPGQKYYIRAHVRGAECNLRVEVNGGNNFGTDNVCDGEWHHMAVVFPKGSDAVKDHDLYVDGKLQVKEGTEHAMDTNDEAQEVTMGDFLAHHTFMFGLFDEVAVFNVDLSLDQIDAIRENGLQAALGVDPQGKLATSWAMIKTY